MRTPNAPISRRQVLRYALAGGCAALGGLVHAAPARAPDAAAAGEPAGEPPGRGGESGATLVVHPVERLRVDVVVDHATFAFAEPWRGPGLAVERLGPRQGPGSTGPRTLAAEFGLAVLFASTRGGETRRVLVDFGFTPGALANNLGLLGLDELPLDALVLTHGHYDHFGGLPAILQGGRLRPGVPFYVGGEEAFCERVSLVRGREQPFGRVDREALAEAGLRVVIAPEPARVADHAFTSGRIPVVAGERAAIPTLLRPGVGCRREALEPAKRVGERVPDDASHELAVCWLVEGAGLVVMSSCSHRGIVSAVERARAISGERRVHAVLGGFHLVWPRTIDEALRTVDALRAIDPRYVVPMHCTGETFLRAALAALPGRVIQPYVGTRLEFGALAG